MSSSPFPPLSWGGIDDVVIVGGGLAGLFCALKLSPRPVTVITALGLGEGAAGRAQGGIAAGLGAGNRIEDHLAETLAAGAGLAEEGVALGVAREAAERVHDLLGFGVAFDRDLNGKLRLFRAAMHSQSRVVRVRGDMAGSAIVAALVSAVRQTSSIRVLEGYVAEQLRAEGHYVTGLVARDRRGGLSDRLLLPTRAVVLASGGIGQLYARTTSPREARGEGLGMAARAGALVADPEFIEFHPTALDVGLDPAPLATDALRVEGALLVDGSGARFAFEFHPEGELAPRHAVARAVQAAKNSGRGAYLDCRQAFPGGIAERFPTVHAACIAARLDPARDLIPVMPAAHYGMGGVHVDAFGRTTLDGLWACGEVACSGLHGASRLAANSLIEAVVFAARAADDIHGQLPNHKVTRWANSPDSEVPPEAAVEDAAMQDLRAVMTRHVGVVREAAGMAEALAAIAGLEPRMRSPQARNALAAAKLIAAAASARRESRGAHYRSDFPDPASTPGARTFTTLSATERTVQAAARLP